jgi:hypothetical protein
MNTILTQETLSPFISWAWLAFLNWWWEVDIVETILRTFTKSVGKLSWSRYAD